VVLVVSMATTTNVGQPAAPGRPCTPQGLESGQGVGKIEVRADEFGFYDIAGIENHDAILKELERRGVLPVVSADVLNAYLARLRGEATIMELELLDRHREALEFLESITEEVEA
jgi:hypothetical protein